MRWFCIHILIVVLAILPMGCSNPFDSSEDTPGELRISAPPASLGLDPFYKKYLDANGIPILGSEKVPDEVFFVVHETILHMLSKRPDVQEAMVKAGQKLAIISKDELITEIPEYRHLANQLLTAQQIPAENFRGFAASAVGPVTAWNEENILCYSKDNTRGYHALVHEFAHAIHLVGINTLEPDFEQRLAKLRQQAMERGLWSGTLASDGTGILHYWTEGVMRWFNAIQPELAHEDFVNHVNTREELRIYDPGLYNLVAEYFPSGDWKPHCFNN